MNTKKWKKFLQKNDNIRDYFNDLGLSNPIDSCLAFETCRAEQILTTEAKFHVRANYVAIGFFTLFGTMLTHSFGKDNMTPFIMSQPIIYMGMGFLMAATNGSLIPKKIQARKELKEKADAWVDAKNKEKLDTPLLVGTGFIKPEPLTGMKPRAQKLVA